MQNFYDKPYRLAPGLLKNNGSDVVMVFNEQRGDMYELNEVSGFILKKLEENLPLRQLVDLLTQEYDVGISEIEQDLEELLSRFVQLKILEFSEISIEGR